jgi:hypothetical protein
VEATQSSSVALANIVPDNARMYTPQAGIFALGTSSHTYLEFDILDAKKRKQFASTISAIREPRTTTGGVNFVIGFRPELWRDIVPDDAPPGVEGFNKEGDGWLAQARLWLEWGRSDFSILSSDPSGGICCGDVTRL